MTVENPFNSYTVRENIGEKEELSRRLSCSTSVVGWG